MKRHPTSEVINLTFFDILIKETVRISNANNKLNVAERQLGLDRAVLLYRNNRSKITNISYYLKLLERCEDNKIVNCTILLQKEIIDDILKYFYAESIVWDYLAQRELKGYNMIDLQEITSQKVAEIQDMQTNLQDEDSSMKDEVWKIRSLKTRIELFFRVYEKAVVAIPTEEMYSLFINAMLDLNKDVRMEGELKRHCLAKAFNMGHTSNLMSVNHYKACVEMLLKSPNGLSQVDQLLKEAVAKQKNEKLYELWMQAYIETRNEPRFYEIFCQANKDLGTAKCISVWKLAFKFYKAYHEEHGKKLDQILKEASKQIHPEFGQFRGYYLEYVMTCESLKKARELYDELCQCPPPCLELHKKMAEIELQAGTPVS